MRRYRLKDMTKGWFVGDFEPSALKTADCEVAVKAYAAGDHEAKHYHLVATEVTLIQSGVAILNGVELGAGDIVVLEPAVTAEFVAVTDVITVVVKAPSVTGDKYLGDPPCSKS